MSNELSTVNDSDTSMYTSLDGQTRADRVRIYNAVNASKPIDEIIDDPINVANVVIQPVEVTNQATGDIEQRYRIVLITDDGEAYGCTSRGVEQAIRNIFAIVGPAPWVPALRMRVQRVKGRNGFYFNTISLLDEN